MATIAELKTSIDAMRSEQANNFRDLHGRVSSLEAAVKLQLHAAPCEHKHPGIEEAIDNLKGDSRRGDIISIISAFIMAAVSGVVSALTAPRQ